MAFNLDLSTSTSATGAAPVRLDRREAGARQDRWMLELEKAMISPESEKHDKAGAADRHSKSTGEEPTSRVFSGAAHSNGETASQTAGRGRERVPHSGPQISISVLPFPNAAWEPQESTAYGAEISPSGAATTGAALRASTALASDDSRPLSVPLPGHLALGALRGEGQTKPHKSLAASELEQPEAAAVAAGADGEGAAFDTRAMHVYVDAEGVHAWIRDAQLQGGQMRAVVQNLVAEVGTTGKRLAALTVNGRPVDPGSGAFYSEEQNELSNTPDDGIDGAPSISYLSQPAFKGNPT